MEAKETIAIVVGLTLSILGLVAGVTTATLNADTLTIKFKIACVDSGGTYSNASCTR